MNIIEEVAKLDADAAQYLRDNVDNFQFAFREDAYSGYRFDLNLDQVMVWNDTPQGHVFWQELNRRIGCGS